MLSQKAIQAILGMKDNVQMDIKDMLPHLKITFHPNSKKASVETFAFTELLRDSFKRLGVEVISYDDIWQTIPIKNRMRRFFKYSLNNILWLFRKIFFLKEVNFYISFKSLIKLSFSKKIKKGITVVCVGEQELDDLPMQFISNFKDNSIITIVDFPEHIDFETDFTSHFDTAMSFFAYHMTNIVIAADFEKWMIYNFNASHPIYLLDDGKFDDHISKGLIPKIVAPISPHKFSDFRISEKTFDVNDPEYVSVINELKEGAFLFSQTNLYPSGKKIDELPFRHNFHRLIGKLHLDNRSGMSFGFIAYQMPVKLPKLTSLTEFNSIYAEAFTESDLFIDENKNLYILIQIEQSSFVMQVPDVWVMTLRSGSDKTNFDVNNDLLKLGLSNGQMIMEFSKDVKINRDYKPSFDTKVILAHAVGSAIIASILKHLQFEDNHFVKSIQSKGVSLSHWHGYFNDKHLPGGVVIFGEKNLHVSCSSPQSAIYALNGKLTSFKDRMNNKSDYCGDIHVEPHHGINVTYPSLVELAKYIIETPDSTELGNKYLNKV